MEILQVQVDIREWFYDEHRAKFMLSLTFLVCSEITSDMYLSADGWLYL